MSQVTARIKVKNKHYEILVDLDEALKVKIGKGSVQSALVTPTVFSDIKKGLHTAKADLIEAFATDDVYEIANKIMISGEIQKTQEFRDTERENKIKQVVNLIIKNAVDQNNRPYTEDRLKRAMDEARVIIDNKPAEQQVKDIIEKLKSFIPIKMEIKKIKLTIPAQYTGQIYGLLKDYKDSEDWLPNGSLQAIISIPAGMQIDFYEKLNHITHGAVQSEEVIEKK